LILKRIFLSLLFTLSFSAVLLHSQTIQELLQQARQSGLTDQQIQQQAAAMGYSVGDYLKLQQSQQTQNQNLNQLRVRSGVDTTVIAPGMVKTDTNRIVPAFNARGDDAKNLPAFGYDIFNYSPTTFQPSVNIPVPNSYVIGPGDEVVITLWGETQLVQNLTVAQDGSIYIPDVGLVYVSGLTMKGLREKLLSVLSKSYSSLDVSAKGSAKTHLDVTTGKLRSVKVYVLGEVNKPGGYTLPALSTAFTALYYSGGPNINGSLRNVQVLRGGKVVSTIDIYDYLIKGDQSSDINLEDEDVLFVPPVGKRVAITGQVFRPAIYELKDGERLKDLLKYAGGTNFNTYFQDVYIDRIIPFDQRKDYQNNVLTTDLKFNTFEDFKNSNYALFDGDLVIIRGINLKQQNRVTIYGDVKQPGAYGLSKDMTVKDLIVKADTVFPDAFFEKALIIRTGQDLTQSIINFNLRKALEGDPVNNILLQNLDSVRIYKEDMFKPVRPVEIFGQVRKPGKYNAYDGMTVSDLITLAGGLTDLATTQNIQVTRMDTINEDTYADKFTVNLPKDYWNSDKNQDFTLKDYDKVFVQADPLKKYAGNVFIRGEVKYPGAYGILNNSEKITDFIKRAGGFKPTAYTKGIYVYRKNKLFHIFEADTTGLTDSSKIKLLESQTIYNRKALVDMYSQRIPIRWDDVMDDTSSIYNLVLDSGDSLIVPRDMNEVYVLGAVGLPATVPYKKSASLDYYINQAGGYASNAIEGSEIVIQPNGKKWEKSGWFFIPDPDIESGSTIIVPAEIETGSDFGPILRDIMAVVSGTVVVIVAIVRLSN
jgi:protein involved in polysaccharide export with SLBB domain